MIILTTKNDEANWFVKSKFPAFADFSGLIPLWLEEKEPVEDALFLNGFVEGRDFEFEGGIGEETKYH